jgi:outer membrane protein OmpA-like peptidoglycan-associated protein
MRRYLLAATLLLLTASAASAQDIAGEVRDLVFQTGDLEFRVEDLGGRVQSLQVRETATETRIELPADILFDFDKALIRATAEPALNQAAEVLRERARGTVTIEGHTDGKGAPAYNQKLSERRAAAVQQWLTGRAGLTQVRFANKGFGASKPAAPNAKPDGSDDPDGRQKNRRVEIVFGRK